MSFKDMVETDNKSIFLNCDEFAEKRTVRYDGEIFKDIPVVLTKVKQSKKSVVGTMEGVHLISAVVHISLSDLNGIIPEQHGWIDISDGEALGRTFFQRYRITTSDCEMGMVVLELEAFDE
ncbi:MAG: hypothetical protein ACI4F5_06490 [Acutalibacteraceae bacterium]